jgi:hypothetical protein
LVAVKGVDDFFYVLSAQAVLVFAFLVVEFAIDEQNFAFTLCWLLLIDD